LATSRYARQTGQRGEIEVLLCRRFGQRDRRELIYFSFLRMQPSRNASGHLQYSITLI
jgi:hypothetical protein